MQPIVSSSWLLRGFIKPRLETRTAYSQNIMTIMTRILSPLADFPISKLFDDKTVAATCFNFYALNTNEPLASVKAEIKAAIDKYAGQDAKQKVLKNIEKSINDLKPMPRVSNI